MVISSLYHFISGIRRAGMLLRGERTIAPWALPPSGAHGTAAFFPTGAGIHRRFPDMPLVTDPPRLVAAAHQDLVRGEGDIEAGVPAGGHLGFQGGQIVEAGEHPPSRTVGTAAALGRPGGDGGLIHMPQGAAPPDLPVAGGGTGRWGQGPVAVMGPLLGQGRVVAGQVVLAGEDLLTRADGTAGASGPGHHHSLPPVAFFTAPPDLLSGPRQELRRGQGAVFLVPLPGQVRVPCGQIVLAGA